MTEAPLQPVRRRPRVLRISSDCQAEFDARAAAALQAHRGTEVGAEQQRRRAEAEALESALSGALLPGFYALLGERGAGDMATETAGRLARYFWLRRLRNMLWLQGGCYADYGVLLERAGRPDIARWLECDAEAARAAKVPAMTGKDILLDQRECAAAVVGHVDAGGKVVIFHGGDADALVADCRRILSGRSE